MADETAANIINAASNVQVRGSERRVRNPHRAITVVKIGIPHCETYPNGTELWVHPRQVTAFQKLYPGAWVIREIHRMGSRPIQDVSKAAAGHATPDEIRARILGKS